MFILAKKMSKEISSGIKILQNSNQVSTTKYADYFIKRIFLACLSGLLLSIPFLSPSHFYLAWIGFIPLLIAIEEIDLLRCYFLGAISGLIFSMSAGYWFINFLMLSKGYGVTISVLLSFIFWVYCAQIFALITLIFNWIKQYINLHECILFPIIVVSVYTLYPMIFTAYLGESQSQFIIAIQATEWVGINGLDAVIALTNVVLYRFFIQVIFMPSINFRQARWPYTAATLVIMSWFYYGWQSNLTWEAKIESWQTIKIGLVQPNETPSLDKQLLYPGYSRAFPPEMAMTEHLANAGAKLVIWPESRFKAYFDKPKVAQAFKDKIDALNIHLIFQDIERIQNPISQQVTKQYNTALMLSNNGDITGKYQKIKRIPFGEYVPFASEMPILKDWVESFFGQFLNEIERGESFKVFNSDLIKKRSFTIIPLICYETMFPSFVAKAVSNALKNAKSADLLVGLSSDGWFGITHQPQQHVNGSILRAVENRLPLVHVVNNGPSIVAMPNGNVILTTVAHQAGGYIVDVPYNPQVGGSFYSRAPWLFIYSVYSLMFITCIFTISKSRYKKSNYNIKLITTFSSTRD
ncbi:MAG: apolipoprotein N-acyltransferase [Crocinitomicaceae bacterium]|jgi:apolipoprotein N-acyltransferase